jgi:hypothetical protein
MAGSYETNRATAEIRRIMGQRLSKKRWAPAEIPNQTFGIGRRSSQSIRCN